MCFASREFILSDDVAILIPILNRPSRIAPLLDNIRNTTPEPHTIYFAASDRQSILELRRLGARHFTDGGDTYPNRINRLFRETTEPYVYLAADDYRFYYGWLTSLLETMSVVDGIVVSDDLFNPNGTACLVSRRYVLEENACVDSPGVIFYPGYQHRYCESEAYQTAASRGRFAYCPESVVEHMHHLAGKGIYDSTYAKGDATIAEDEALFESRKHLWTR